MWHVRTIVVDLRVVYGRKRRRRRKIIKKYVYYIDTTNIFYTYVSIIISFAFGLGDGRIYYWNVSNKRQLELITLGQALDSKVLSVS